jgi:N-acetylglucosaminyldiphosphoundecaprenol N-acetyl-beta-D-mannosaminyltransferase
VPSRIRGARLLHAGTLTPASPDWWFGPERRSPLATIAVVPSPADAVRSTPERHRVDVGDVAFDQVTQSEVVETVEQAWLTGRGGWIVTPNVDIWLRTRRDASCAELVSRADLVVADGMPLVWASRIAGTPLPERVTGSGLVERLCAAAGSSGRALFIVGGGAPEIAERAGAALAVRYPGLRFTGAVTPEYGFERDPRRVQELVAAVRDSGADLVLVGLGFPKQERIAELVRAELPAAWVLGCGGGIAMASGDARRSPPWAQRLGVEWVVRLAQEPRRLSRRYLVDDAPAAIVLLWGALRARLRRGR